LEENSLPSVNELEQIKRREKDIFPLFSGECEGTIAETQEVYTALSG
jgi:hypothetical protein